MKHQSALQKIPTNLDRILLNVQIAANPILEESNDQHETKLHNEMVRSKMVQSMDELTTEIDLDDVCSAGASTSPSPGL